MNEADEFIPTRRSLLSRLRNWKDEESWAVFFNTYWKLIYNAAIRAGLTGAEAEDVVQETVIAVAKKIPGFVYDPAKGSFKTWLMRQTNWRILGQLRKRMPIEKPRIPKDTHLEEDALELVIDPAVPALDAVWDEEWERNLVEAAVQRVKAEVDSKQYQIFDLCVHQKWPASKIAHDLKVTTASVYLAKHRIGRLIKKEVDQLRTGLL